MIKIINVYKDSRVMEMTSSSNLGLGVRTDNDVDLLRFTFDEMIVGTAQLLTSLTDEYGELVAFPLIINQEENSYDIEVTKYLASQGNFTIQLEITTNGMIWHSKQAEVILDDCLAVGEGDMPSVVDNWLQNANIVLAEMEEATTGAEKVNVEVEEVDDTYEVTFTDRNGNETQATIYQGKNANVVGSYDTSDTNAYSTNYVNNQISTPLSQETTNRQNADNELQSQIDAITVSSDVVDIVGTYQDLQNYDTQHIKANDIIKVLQDSTHNDALSYYRWVITQNVGSWVYVGSEGPFYTKSETDSLLNNKVDTTTFNTSQQAQDTLIANKVNTTTYNQGQATQDTKITNLENQVFGDETIEGEGTSLTLNGTLKGQFNELDLKGNTSQDGTPTPTSPIPVNVVSGDNAITISNQSGTDSNAYNIDLPVENLLNLANEPIFSANASKTFIEPRIEIIKTNTDASAFCLFEIGNASELNGKNLKLTGQCLATGTTNGKAILGYADANGQNRTGIVNSGSLGNTNIDMSMSVDGITYATKKVVLWLYGDISTTGSVGDAMTYENIMVSPQTGAYTPFGITPIELCKIGDYQDYFYKDSDKWYLHKEIGKVVLDGTQAGARRETNTNNCYRFIITVNNVLRVANSETKGAILCDKFVTNTLANTYMLIQGINAGITSTDYYRDICIYCDETKTWTWDEFKTWLASNNVTLYYALATPINELVEYQPLIDQLNLLEKTQSKENQTNISQVNNDLPFIISASAFLNNINGKIALLDKLMEV